MGTPSILIFTNKFFLKLSDFPALPSSEVSLGNLEASFDELVLARFFLNERIGGHPTTGATSVLLLFKMNQNSRKDTKFSNLV